MFHVPGHTIIRLLNKGGFGHVHLARRDLDGMQVAIKFLHHLGDDNVRRFYREAKLLHQQLGNPFVVRLFHADFQGASPYIVMEYCAGGSLRSWVGGDVDWLEIVFALSNVASGLSKLHELKGFHRDIKPDNLLVAKNDDGSRTIKIGDFGVARVPQTSAQGMTRSAWGTEGYMAPELSRGEAYSTECDVYSLGITGIELLTGVRNSAKLNELVELPQQLRELLLLMSHVRPSHRPTIDDCRQILVNIGQNEHARRHDQADQAAKAEATRNRQTLERQARQAKAAHQVSLQAASQAEARQMATGAGLSLGALAALVVGGIALANMNSRDGSGRWRDSDGKFRSGRWG